VLITLGKKSQGCALCCHAPGSPRRAAVPQPHLQPLLGRSAPGLAEPARPRPPGEGAWCSGDPGRLSIPGRVLHQEEPSAMYALHRGQPKVPLAQMPSRGGASAPTWLSVFANNLPHVRLCRAVPHNLMSWYLGAAAEVCTPGLQRARKHRAFLQRQTRQL